MAAKLLIALLLCFAAGCALVAPDGVHPVRVVVPVAPVVVVGDPSPPPVLLVGYVEAPGQAGAVELIWRQSFGESTPPPVIEWREDVCPYKAGPSAVVYQGVCYSGLTLPAVSLVAWRGSMHASAMSHELLHQHQARQGVYDPDHLRPEWSVVPQLDAMLAAEGL